MGGYGPELYRGGLICRVDDRGDPVIELAPPPIAAPRQCEEIEAILRPVLTAAGERFAGRPPSSGCCRRSASSWSPGRPRRRRRCAR